MADKLRDLECPINWLEQIPWTTADGRKQLLNKLDGEFEDADSSSTWQKFSQRLVLAYLEYHDQDGDLRKMKNFLEMIENIVDENKHDDFINKYEQSIEYVNNAMLAHYFHKQGRGIQVENYLAKPAFKDLPAKIRAGIFSIKACCIMEYGPGEASKSALKAINEALELDPEVSEWLFLKGKCMARSRRYYKHRGAPTQEELDILRRAAQCSVLPSHWVFCGQSLLDYAIFSPECSSGQPAKLTNRLLHMDEAIGYMRKAANVGEKHPVVLTRVAKGLMKVYGRPDVDELVQRCVLTSLELLPSSGLVNEVAGDYFRSRERNQEKALRHFSVAAHHHEIFSSYLKLFDVMLYAKTESELDNEVCRFWEKKTGTALERVRALRPMTAYYFFVKNDVIRAATYWREWILSTYLNNEVESSHHSCTFVWTEDLTKDMVGEVQLRLRNPRSNLTSDDEAKLRSFLEIVIDARPDIDIDIIMSSREKRIKKYLWTVKPLERRKIVEERLKVKLPPPKNRPNEFHCPRQTNFYANAPSNPRPAFRCPRQNNFYQNPRN